MATVDPVIIPAQKTEEFKLRAKRTLKQVVGAFVLVAGPQALFELKSDDLITYPEGKVIVVSGITAASVFIISALMNYFKPVQTNA